MCARYQAIDGPEPFAEYRLRWGSPHLSECRLQMFPRYLGPVIRERGGEVGLDAMNWGLIPFWARAADPKQFRNTFNARAETVDRLPSFRTPFRSRRCLVPAANFTEFPLIDGQKSEHQVHSSTGAPLMFAGLWDRWSDENEELHSFTIITTESHPGLRWLHHRMPVILPREAHEAWLDPALPLEDARALLISPAPEMLIAIPAAAPDGR